MPLKASIKPYLSKLKQLRHRLHAMAEISGDEQQTAEYMAGFLQECGPDTLRTGVGGYGILATFNGKDEGPHILIRCELDGLPIADEIEASYRSQTEGVGHKCGHDGHMAIVAGVAKLLGKERSDAGKVSLLYQPAEETGEGAQRVIEDSEFPLSDFDYCFALHNLPGYPRNQIIVRSGTFAAASVGLIINFKGATAHAAHPEEGRSPAQAVGQTIQSLSAAPQFHVPLEKAAKVTVIHAKLGEQAFGTSPGRGTVMATLRTYDDILLSRLKEHCISIAEGHAATHNLDMDYEWVEEFPATVNDEKATDIISSAASKAEADITLKPKPFSWSEDFGYFTQQYCGAMFGLGAGADHSALHAGNYDFPDAIIATGVSMFMEIINEVSNK